MYIGIYVNMYSCICVNVYICICVYMYRCIYVNMYMRLYMYIWLYMCISPSSNYLFFAWPKHVLHITLIHTATSQVCWSACKIIRWTSQTCTSDRFFSVPATSPHKNWALALVDSPNFPMVVFGIRTRSVGRRWPDTGHHIDQHRIVHLVVLGRPGRRWTSFQLGPTGESLEKNSCKDCLNPGSVVKRMNKSL